MSIGRLRCRTAGCPCALRIVPVQTGEPELVLPCITERGNVENAVFSLVKACAQRETLTNTSVMHKGYLEFRVSQLLIYA